MLDSIHDIADWSEFWRHLGSLNYWEHFSSQVFQHSLGLPTAIATLGVDDK